MLLNSLSLRRRWLVRAGHPLQLVPQLLHALVLVVVAALAVPIRGQRVLVGSLNISIRIVGTNPIEPSQ